MEARQRLGADRSLTILVADTATLKVIARVGGEGAEHALGQRGTGMTSLGFAESSRLIKNGGGGGCIVIPVSYTHLRAHET